MPGLHNIWFVAATFGLGMEQPLGQKLSSAAQ